MSIKLHDIVKAQIDHIETDIIPYSIAFEREPLERMTQKYGDNWNDKIIPFISIHGGIFDSWDTMKPIDPKKPEKVIDAYGSVWTKTEDIAQVDLPALKEVLLKDYRFPTLENFLTPEKEEKLIKDCAASDMSYRIINLGAAYYEYTWRLLGIEGAFELIIEDPDAYDYILDNLNNLLYSFVDSVAGLPADAMMFGDDWCDQRGCMMGPERWRGIFKPRLAGLFRKVHMTGKKVIMHVCGSIADIMPDLIEIGLDVVESVQPEAKGMNPYLLKSRFGKNITFWGALGCQNIVTFGTPEDLRAEIRKLRTEMPRGGGYILAPAKTLNSTIPTANLSAIYETFIEENYKLTG